MKNILFVCTGNLCRSPMAEGYCRSVFEQKSLPNLKIHSAGTHAVPGARPTAEACMVCENQGIDISQHGATFLNKKIIDEADFIFAMEVGHLETILLFSPQAKEKSYLLGQWAKGKFRSMEIQDPMTRPMRVYEDSFNRIVSAIDNLVEQLFLR